MVSVVLGLRQVLVWAGEQVQQSGQKKEGGREAEGGSDNIRTASWCSEEREGGKESVKMFHGRTGTGIPSQWNVYQDLLEDGMWSEQATFNPWNGQATFNPGNEQATFNPWNGQATFNPGNEQATFNPGNEQATSRPHSCPGTSGGKEDGNGSCSETVGDENIDTEQVRLCQRLQSELGFKFEDDDEEESDGDLDPESSFRDEAVTLQSYSFQNLDSGFTSGQQHPWNGSGYTMDDDDDDGWISDKEITAPVLQPIDTAASTAPALKSYMYYDDDVWVDEAKAVFSTCKKEQPEIKLRPLLREMFEAHHDVFCLILAFLRRSGKIRQPKLSLPRIVVTEFQEWLKEKRSSGEKNKTAILTPDHQEQALKILTRCHPILLDDTCTIFDLKSVNRELQLSLIQSLLDLGKLKEAVTYTWKFQVQNHFSMEEMLLPLVVMDKINLIENYIGESRQLQCEFVTILDRLCGPGTSYKQLSSQLASSCRLGGKGVLTLEALEQQQQSPNNKLNPKQLFKLGMRFIQKYNLELDKFPLFSERKASSSLHYLLQKKYVEGSITDGNTDELIEVAVTARPALQLQLVQELVQFRDMEAAARWAVQCKIPLEHLPCDLQSYLTTHRVRHSVWPHPHPSSTQHPSHSPEDFYELQLPLDCVFFVEDLQGLQLCWETLTQPNSVIGVDAEWRLPACNGGIERLAVLQLAVADSVFLLDMVHLPRRVKENTLRQFVSEVFGSKESLKLGYGIDGDLHMLARSWVFVADIAACPVRVVDLRVFARMVSMLDAHPGSGSGKTLPEHPLLSQLNHQHGTRNYSPSSSHAPSPSTKTSPPLQHNLPAPEASREDPSRKDPSRAGGEESSAYSSSDPSVKRRGLSALVMKYLGKPLDKSQQLSDWEKRPLRVEQVKYAALDAYCLLKLYSLLRSQALAADPYFNVEPTISATKAGRSIFKRQKEEKGLIKSKPEVQNPPKRIGTPIRPRELSVVMDTMLQGLGRYLRCCGVDVKILSVQQNHYDAVKVCLKEGRIVLTSGAPFFVMKDLVPAGMCVHVRQGKARDQVLEVLDHFNVCVTEKDIFSRCQVCNGDTYVRIEVADFREIVNLVKQESGLVTLTKISRNIMTSETCGSGHTTQSATKLEDCERDMSLPAADILEPKVGSSGISAWLEGKSPTVHCTSVGGEEQQQVPLLPPGSMTSVKDCPFARVGEGLSLQLTTTGHEHTGLNRPSSVMVVSRTGVVVQVADVPEGILDRVTEFYCCTACGKVFWEGKHFAHVVYQFQHVLEFSRQL